TGGDAGGLGGSAGSSGTSGSGEASGSGEFTTETSDWFAPRKGKPNPGGSGGAGGAAGSGPAYGSGDPYGAGGSDPYGSGGAPQSALRGLMDDGGTTGTTGTETPADGVPAVGGPGGPTTGPAMGDTPLPPHPGTGGPAESPASSTLGLGTGRAPFAPGGVGEDMFPGGSGSGGSGSGDPGEARVSGGTLVSGIPRVPSGAAASSSPFARSASAGSAASARRTGRTPGRTSDGPSGVRSKLVLAGAGLFGLVGIAYGAGLLFDHADVPTGTTVLGNDIGGTTKHEAVNKLDAAFGNRTVQPFTVVAGGKQTQLKPSVAGLTLDTEATVRAAAGRDYNPVSVIGSLFGAERQAEPAIKVDKEKMASALSKVSQETGNGGAPKDGMVKFIRGKAVAVPGKTHKGVDPGDAGAALQKAYRDRAATGKNSPVRLPVSMQRPKVGKAEINRAIKAFGKPAMSGLVTIKAGSASIQFSPQKSLPKFLSMKPVNGTLVDTYNLPALQQLYGTTFAGVKITRGDGSKTPVMPQDVAGALRLALKETSPAKRVQEIPTNPR
ncbi:MAG: hypothetical protein ACRDP3_18070, partial [Streptomyces sp.]|uniref:hypothetical protein n=1 Tax=Streptomyces sp. TaxID=1931 RepID=UPI003D6A8765